ncbi:MAG: 2-amino-4-hydroxy-6-hydroxymethyldihydropteridine diphosphokinase [Bacteroidaceae bacterium]|nr:2-amino-4-hydroxy-6-hydroxymethyldihydropteridine diphosphokinase [Bacteroidaceae bacterium]
MNKEDTIYLGLGTNQGNKEENIRGAIEELSHLLGTPTAVATIIETEPWGFQSDNSFLNTVVAFKSTLAPEEILKATQEIERRLGRTKKSIDGCYSDRPIDIDILLYGSRVIESPQLTIPHPLLHKRLFVLQPLAQIAPGLIHPILGKSIARLLKEF